jgi:integration host factor subunit alpha
MTKQHIINKVANKLNITAKEARPLVEAVFDLLKTSLENCDNIEISGFGKFIVRQKNKRIGRNPKTGEEAEISSRKVVMFKSSEILRKAVNKP